MEGTVKLPGVGPVKKEYAYAGIAGVGVLVIIWYRKKHSGTAPAAPAPGSDPYPPDGTTGNPGDLYSIDPATGQTYGDEQAGFGAGTGVTGGGGVGIDPATGLPGFYDPASGSWTDFGSGGGNVSTQVTSGPPFSSNAAWAQYAISQLVDTENRSASAVGDALGLYLAGRPVDSAQEQIVNDAVAVAGQPPVHGANGYPPSIRLAGTKTGGKVYADNPPTGLRATATDNAVTLTWNDSRHAGSYQVTITDKGRKVHQEDVTTARAHVTGLHPGTEYSAAVQARPARPSAPSAHARFTTRAAGGSGKVRVPNVEGRQAAEARRAIEAAGLRASFVPRAVGIVAFEVPKPGTEVSHGSAVALHMAATG